MKQITLQILLLVFTLLVSNQCKHGTKNTSGDFEYIYQCDAENTNADKSRFPELNNQDVWFGNIETQVSDNFVSGKHSLKLTPKHPYGFTTELYHIGSDEFIEVEVWRKNTNNNGVIVIDGGQQGFYTAGKNIMEEKNGWQKIHLEVLTPANFFNKKVVVFVWNNSSDSVYFDDIKITHRNKKVYPEYPEIHNLQIHAEKNDLQYFNKKRISAFEKSILVNSDEDYANVVLYDGVEFLNGSFRLKGDLLDHIQGQKWSFRIKLKKGFAWKNMCTFSIQNPSTRNFLSEWIAHQLFKKEDVLSTRYGFIPVKMNNESLGIYAWEEHFEKQLIENQNRREGPIIRFNENIFWLRVLESKQTNREWDIDFFDAAKIIPFKEGRTSADSLLNMQLVEAQKLLLQYKNSSMPVSEIFDVNKLAKYYALVDITQAYHGFTWHNQRFYYNPVTCLLEPIAFDGYIEGGIYKRIDERITGLLRPDNISTFEKEELMLFQAFADPLFQKKYINYLNKYSNPDFINQFISEYQLKTDSISKLIKKEFPYYTFNFNTIKEQAEYIQNNLEKITGNVEKLGEAVLKLPSGKFKKEYTSDINKNLIPFLVHAYFNKKEKQITVLNFQNSPVKVLGAFIKDGFPETFENHPELEAHNGENPSQIIIPVAGVPIKILFEIENQTFETEVSQWEFSEGKSSRQIAANTQLPAELTKSKNTIEFDGNYQFETDIIIPDSFKVSAQPGTQIDLIKGASFISFSAIDFIGSETSPIKITSSDKSANGFSILQPQKNSILKYVHFSGLSSIQKGGWETPAAVTFYEANVNFENCIFAKNSNCDDALNVVRSEFACTNCTFENTFADAFDSDFSTGTVLNCNFNTIGNDAIDFSGSNVDIRNCKMVDIKDKAISGGEHSYLKVSDCEIEKANIGVAAKDLSHLELNKITMNTTTYGIVAFVKKPEYGPAKITIDNLRIKNNLIFHQIEQGSLLIINGKTIEGRERNLAIKLYQ